MSRLHLDFVTSPASLRDFYASLGMSNVDFHMEWDLDGDTRFSSQPRFFFVDTGGVPVEFSSRMRFGNFGIGSFNPGIIATDFQLGWKWKTAQVCWFSHCKTLFKYPTLWKSGPLTFGSNPGFEVLMPNEQWYKVPIKLLV